MSAREWRGVGVLAATAGCWGVWVLGGMALAWLGLDDLDVVGRVVLVFGFLSLCQGVVEKFSRHP